MSSAVSELDREKYRELWRAVIYRAIEDLYFQSELPLYEENLKWFDVDSDDFQTVCALAELDEQNVVRIVKVWSNTKDKRIVRLMMMKERICSPTEKDKI
jgi:hypothetical protein